MQVHNKIINLEKKIKTPYILKWTEYYQPCKRTQTDGIGGSKTLSDLGIPNMTVTCLYIFLSLYGKKMKATYWQDKTRASNDWRLITVRRFFTRSFTALGTLPRLTELICFYLDLSCDERYLHLISTLDTHFRRTIELFLVPLVEN